MRTIFSSEPEAVMFCPLSNGLNDMWLRKNIVHIDADPENEYQDDHYEADEEYIRSKYTRDYVNEHFDEVYDEAAIASMGEVTEAERLDAIEAALMDIMEMMING